MKTNGAMLKNFLSDSNFWEPSPTESWYFEDVNFIIQDGVNRESMDSAYELYGGTLEKIPDDTPIKIEG